MDLARRFHFSGYLPKLSQHGQSRHQQTASSGYGKLRQILTRYNLTDWKK
jgi:hypothetical protein